MSISQISAYKISRKNCIARNLCTRISFDEMNEIIRQKQIANFKEQLEKDRTISLSFTKVLWPKTTSSYTDTEQVEFKMQVEVNPTEHKNNTVKVLNAVSTMTQTAKESIVLIETIGFVT